MTEVIWVHPPIDSRCPYQILTSTQWIVQGFHSSRGRSGEPSDSQTDSGIAVMAHKVFSPPLATAHDRFWSRTGPLPSAKAAIFHPPFGPRRSLFPNNG